MRHVLSKWAVPVVVAWALVGCKDGGESDGSGGSAAGDPTAQSSAGQGGAGQGGAGSGGAGQGGSGSTGSGGDATTGTGAGTPGDPGWTIVPLIDDGDIFHTGNSLVTGIHFTSLDAGVIAVAGDNQTFADGGALFGATQNEVTDVRFRGDGSTSLCLLGTVDFTGLAKTSTGYIAMAYACDLIRSVDGGETFTIEPVGAGEPFGIEDILAFQEREGGHTLVRDTGVVSVTSDALGESAVWDDRWAPQGVPPTPNPVPDDQCQRGPQSNNVPSRPQAVFVSEDGGFIAYSSQEGDELAAICVSNDGGVSFFPKMLPVTGEDAIGFAPSGVHFTSATNGIAWFATNIYEGQSYLMRTTDGGETWSEVALPADVAPASIEMNAAFFAPDGQHGWIVGYDYDHSLALMIRTTDGGATWDSESGDLAARVSEAGGSKLFTGFALDANHIWVGGEYGALLSNSAAGL